MAMRAGDGPGGVHLSVLLAVGMAVEGAGADANAQRVAGKGFELAVRCRRQVVAAVSGVDAGDEDHEYGDYRAG